MEGQQRRHPARGPATSSSCLRTNNVVILSGAKDPCISSLLLPLLLLYTNYKFAISSESTPRSQPNLQIARFKVGFVRLEPGFCHHPVFKKQAEPAIDPLAGPSGPSHHTSGV